LLLAYLVNLLKELTEHFCDPKYYFWQLKGFELVKDVHLDPEPFDMERDLITPTYKKKRPQLLKYYQVSLLYILGDLITPVCMWH